MKPSGDVKLAGKDDTVFQSGSTKQSRSIGRWKERETMAPRKRKATAEGGEVTEAVTAAVAEEKKEGGVVGRVTRSSSRLVSQESVAEPKKKAPVKEKAVKKAKVEKKKKEEEEEEEDVKEKEKEVVEGENGGKAKTIVIEHW